MTPERVAALVARWVHFYTRDLAGPTAQRRIAEIDADLHDHIAHEREAGISERRIVLQISSRMLRGMAADAAWRRRQGREKTTKTRRTANRSVVRVTLVTALILLVPLVAMQFTSEVVWTLTDFLVAGALLGETGLALDLALTSGRHVVYKAAVGTGLIAGLLLIWVNLAVGVVGDEDELFNVLYLGVLAVGIIGSVVARLRPEGMARALLATAVAQVLVAVIALIAGKAAAPGSSVAEIFGVNALFVTLFAASAWLFRRAARRRPPAGAKLAD